MNKFIPVSQPSISQREIDYVNDAVSSGWVSSIGKYIEQFEQQFAKYCGVEYALATSNGTTGLHLALLGLGIGHGDEVIVPDFTFVATANAVVHAGAKPVLVDIDQETLCIDPQAIRKAITKQTRAIIPVHLYGHPANMKDIMEIANEFGLKIIEDAAEAHGALFNGKRVGGLGDCGVFSFYGNKIITTGEGGMITTDDEQLYIHAKALRDHAMSPQRRYWHEEIGYNYRITNLQAALGVAQMERIDLFISKRREIMQWYKDALANISSIRLNREQPGCQSVYWTVCIEIAGLTDERRANLMDKLRSRGIDSRPFFYPLSDMPMFAKANTPVTHAISPTGIILPSHFDISSEDVRYICEELKSFLRSMNLI